MIPGPLAADERLGNSKGLIVGLHGPFNLGQLVFGKLITGTRLRVPIMVGIAALAVVWVRRQ